MRGSMLTVIWLRIVRELRYRDGNPFLLFLLSLTVTSSTGLHPCLDGLTSTTCGKSYRLYYVILANSILRLADRQQC